MCKLSTRIGANWLVLTHLRERTWRLQVWGESALEAEVTAGDETEAKNSAVAATLERLNIGLIGPSPVWNIATTRRWDSRQH